MPVTGLPFVFTIFPFKIPPLSVILIIAPAVVVTSTGPAAEVKDLSLVLYEKTAGLPLLSNIDGLYAYARTL